MDRLLVITMDVRLNLFFIGWDVVEGRTAVPTYGQYLYKKKLSNNTLLYYHFFMLQQGEIFLVNEALHLYRVLFFSIGYIMVVSIVIF